MFRQIAAILTLTCLSVTPTPILADDKEKLECFCLRHHPTGSVVHFGCESRTLLNKFTPETRCLGPNGKSKVKIDSMEGMEKIVAGEADCEPCVPEFRSIRGRTTETIRGDEKESE